MTRLRKWYSDLLVAAASLLSGSEPAIRGFKNIGEAYPKMTPLQIPYFEGDNWPDILEDVIKLDEKQQTDDRKKGEIRIMVAHMQAAAWAENAVRRQLFGGSVGGCLGSVGGCLGVRRRLFGGSVGGCLGGLGVAVVMPGGQTRQYVFLFSIIYNIRVI